MAGHCGQTGVQSRLAGLVLISTSKALDGGKRGRGREGEREGGERDRDRERHRERDRQTETHTERQRQRETERENALSLPNPHYSNLSPRLVEYWVHRNDKGRIYRGHFQWFTLTDPPRWICFFLLCESCFCLVETTLPHPFSAPPPPPPPPGRPPRLSHSS